MAQEEEVKLTMDDLMAFADSLSHISIALFVFRSQGVRNNVLNDHEQLQLRELERRLDGMAAVLTGRAIDLIVGDAQLKTADLLAAVGKAHRTLVEIGTIKDAIALATAVLGVAGAVLTGEAKTIVEAIGRLQATAEGTAAAPGRTVAAGGNSSQT